MTEEEFKAEILKANPQAVFIERRNGDLECTETEMNVGVVVELLHVVYGFSSAGFAKTENADFANMSAPAPKKKRLMTPQECAGKWITTETGLSRELIHGYTNQYVNTRGNHGFSPEFIHTKGWKIADTPVSEPYSLEVGE